MQTSDVLLVGYFYDNMPLPEKLFQAANVRYSPERGGYLFDHNGTFKSWGYTVYTWALQPNAPRIATLEEQEIKDGEQTEVF